MTVHKTECEAGFFNEIRDGRMTFDIVEANAPFQSGDIVQFISGSQEGGAFHEDGRSLYVPITYVLHSNDIDGLEEGYCALGLANRRSEVSADHLRQGVAAGGCISSSGETAPMSGGVSASEMRARNRIRECADAAKATFPGGGKIPEAILWDEIALAFSVPAWPYLTPLQRKQVTLGFDKARQVDFAKASNAVH